ncbi:MAG: metallophosphoesterase family protein [Acidimicrobiia bacterium]|nr:metallophosphoesterase family protein [Acidimicrobiia bacterium]
MSRFFTADLHFGHANIIRYCQRPFADVEEMDEALVEAWNDVVTDDDEVWVLGDVAMGQLRSSLAHVGRLRGRKVLVPGNHDRCWPGNGPHAADWVGRYLDAGFAEITSEIVELRLGGEPVVVCHFPYEGDSHDDDRFRAHRPTDEGRVLLHGHVHTSWQLSGRQINVGCDVWEYRPVGTDVLAGLVVAAGGR